VSLYADDHGALRALVIFTLFTQMENADQSAGGPEACPALTARKIR